MKMTRFLFKTLTVVATLSLSTHQGHSQLKRSPIVTEATRVLELLRAGDAAAIHILCTDKMKAALPEEQLSGLWKGIEGQFGPFKGVSDTSTSSKDSLEIVALVCDFEKGSLQASLAFEPSGKLAGLFFGLAPPERGIRSARVCSTRGLQRRRRLFRTCGMEGCRNTQSSQGSITVSSGNSGSWIRTA